MGIGPLVSEMCVRTNGKHGRTPTFIVPLRFLGTAGSNQWDMRAETGPPTNIGIASYLYGLLGARGKTVGCLFFKMRDCLIGRTES